MFGKPKPIMWKVISRRRSVMPSTLMESELPPFQEKPPRETGRPRLQPRSPLKSSDSRYSSVHTEENRENSPRKRGRSRLRSRSSSKCSDSRSSSVYTEENRENSLRKRGRSRLQSRSSTKSSGKITRGSKKYPLTRSQTKRERRRRRSPVVKPPAPRSYSLKIIRDTPYRPPWRLLHFSSKFTMQLRSFKLNHHIPVVVCQRQTRPDFSLSPVDKLKNGGNNKTTSRTVGSSTEVLPITSKQVPKPMARPSDSSFDKYEDPTGFRDFDFTPTLAAYEGRLKSISEESQKRKLGDISKSGNILRVKETRDESHLVGPKNSLNNGSLSVPKLKDEDFNDSNLEATEEFLLPIPPTTSSMRELRYDDVAQVFAALNHRNSSGHDDIDLRAPSGHDDMDPGTPSGPDAIDHENSSSQTAIPGTSSGHDTINHGTLSGPEVIDHGRRLASGHDVENKGAAPIFFRPWNIGVESTNTINHGNPSGQNAIGPKKPSGPDAIDHGNSSGQNAINYGTPSGHDTFNHGTSSGHDAIDYETPPGDAIHHQNSSGQNTNDHGTRSGQDANDYETPSTDAIDHENSSSQNAIDCGTSSSHDAIDYGTPSGHDAIDPVTSSGHDTINHGTLSGPDAIDPGRRLASGHDVESRGVAPVFFRPWTIWVESTNTINHGNTSGQNASGTKKLSEHPAMDPGTSSGRDTIDHGNSSGHDAIDSRTPSGQDDMNPGTPLGDAIDRGTGLASGNDVQSRGVAPVFFRPWTLGVESTNNIDPVGSSETIPVTATSSQTNQLIDILSDPESITHDQNNVIGPKASETKDAEHNAINSDAHVPNTSELLEELMFDDEIDSTFQGCRQTISSIMEDLKNSMISMPNYDPQSDGLTSKRSYHQDKINAELGGSIPHRNPGTSSNQTEILKHPTLNLPDQNRKNEDPTVKISNSLELTNIGPRLLDSGASGPQNVRPIIGHFNGNRRSSQPTHVNKRSRQEQENKDSTVKFIDMEGNYVVVRHSSRTSTTSDSTRNSKQTVTGTEPESETGTRMHINVQQKQRPSVIVRNPTYKRTRRKRAFKTSIRVEPVLFIDLTIDTPPASPEEDDNDDEVQLLTYKN